MPELWLCSLSYLSLRVIERIASRSQIIMQFGIKLFIPYFTLLRFCSVKTTVLLKGIYKHGSLKLVAEKKRK